eukprot:9457617-Pyramimonas_sp.AAC.1
MARCTRACRLACMPESLEHPAFQGFQIEYPKNISKHFFDSRVESAPLPVEAKRAARSLN